jgi:hypothetical protein
MSLLKLFLLVCGRIVHEPYSKDTPSSHCLPFSGFYCLTLFYCFLFFSKLLFQYPDMIVLMKHFDALIFLMNSNENSCWIIHIKGVAPL